MRTPLKAVLLLIFALVPSLANAVDRPNVLLIITDEHNFRTLGCYRELLPREQAEMWGADVVVPTPNLDRLANEGVICTRAYATAPVCSPCRAAMITGRYPHMTGVPSNDLPLDRSIPTLADRLNEEGYRTTFIGKWHLGGTGKPEWAPMIDGGFQFKKFMFNRGHWKKFVIENDMPAVGATKNGKPSYDVDGADHKTFSTDWLTDRAIEFTTDPEASKPFLTVISYPDPHGPNTVRAPYDHRFDDLRFAAPRTYQTGIPAPGWLGAAKKHPVFRGKDMSLYFDMVQCIDDNIGRLLDRLRESGQLDNTLIIMTSDHGDLCYEHDRQNKGNPYEGSARVPMILRQPNRIAAKQVYEQPVGTVDLTPTIMGLLGLPADPADQGRDLSAVLSDVSKATTDDANPPITFLRNAGTSARWVAAVDARYKLILSVDDAPWLFDAQQDPDELLNFYGRPGTEGVAERLGKALREYGVANEDPYLKNAKIAASLARVLGDPVPKVDSTSEYKSQWKGSRLWVGPDWWPNPMTDWSTRNGAVTSAAAANRTLCLLTADLDDHGNEFTISVEVEALRAANAGSKIGAGFRIGRRGGIEDYRHALVHATNWIDAKIRRDGRLVLGEAVSEADLALEQGPIKLTLSGRRDGDSVNLSFVATRDSKEISVSSSFPIKDVRGGVSLLSDGPLVAGRRKCEHAFCIS